MTEHVERSIARLRERIDESDDIQPGDRDVLRGFDRQLTLLGSRYSDQRHQKLLMRAVKLAEEVGGLADALEEKRAAEEIVAWIHDTYDNEETNRDYRIALRMLGEHATDGEGKPDSVEWIPSTYSNTYDPAPNPADMLRWDEDVLPMIGACKNYRDSALVALAWDLGPRSGELYGLERRNIVNHKYGMQVTLEGKRGQRSPVLVPSVPYVRQWLDVHPGDGRGEYMWTKLNSPERVSRRMIQKILDEAADRAGVGRPVTPTNFRKSSASYLASEGVSQAHLEDHHGWKRGSEVASRYISVFGDAAEREIARVHGVDVEEDEADPVGPLECPRCNRETPRHEPQCVWCGQAMSQQAAETVAEQDSEVRQQTASTEGELSAAVAELGDLLDRHPELRETTGDFDG